MEARKFGLLFVILNTWTSTLGEISCPSYQEIPFCSCFVLDDQLHVQCSGNDIPALEKSLTVLNGPVKTFSVYDLETRASILPNGLTDNVTSPILHFSVILTFSFQYPYSGDHASHKSEVESEASSLEKVEGWNLFS